MRRNSSGHPIERNKSKILFQKFLSEAIIGFGPIRKRQNLGFNNRRKKKGLFSCRQRERTFWTAKSPPRYAIRIFVSMVIGYLFGRFSHSLLTILMCRISLFLRPRKIPAACVQLFGNGESSFPTSTGLIIFALFEYIKINCSFIFTIYILCRKQKKCKSFHKSKTGLT